MADNLADRVLDNGLASLKSEATHIYICNAEPTTYAEAISTFALGSKNFGAGNVFPGAIAAGSPNGRKITHAAVTDGAITASGTATKKAFVDATNTQLLAVGDLTSDQVVTTGNPFTLTSADVRIPGQ